MLELLMLSKEYHNKKKKLVLFSSNYSVYIDSLMLVSQVLSKKIFLERRKHEYLLDAYKILSTLPNPFLWDTSYVANIAYHSIYYCWQLAIFFLFWSMSKPTWEQLLCMTAYVA